MIIVCPLSCVQRLVDHHRASRVVSLLGPDTPHRRFEGIHHARHLQLTFHDICEPMEGLRHPEPADAERLIEFLHGWNGCEPLLIHCWAGISRSTAAAFTAMCMLTPEASEMEIAVELRRASPSATPNRLIVSYTDALLGRAGRMLAAVEAIGGGADAVEAIPFVLGP